MIAKSTISFAELRQILLDLGFILSKRRKFWFFEHAPSETTFLFRPHRCREKVTLVDIDSTRFHLDWRGLLTPVGAEFGQDAADGKWHRSLA